MKTRRVNFFLLKIEIIRRGAGRTWFALNESIRGRNVGCILSVVRRIRNIAGRSNAYSTYTYCIIRACYISRRVSACRYRTRAFSRICKRMHANFFRHLFALFYPAACSVHAKSCQKRFAGALWKTRSREPADVLSAFRTLQIFFLC